MVRAGWLGVWNPVRGEFFSPNKLVQPWGLGLFPSKADVENEWSFTSSLPLCLDCLCRTNFPHTWRHIIEFARTITERFLLRLRCSFPIHTSFGYSGIQLVWKSTSIQGALLAFLHLSWMYKEECSTRLSSSFHGKHFSWNPTFLLGLPGTAGRAFCAYFKWKLENI